MSDLRLFINKKMQICLQLNIEDSANREQKKELAQFLLPNLVVAPTVFRCLVDYQGEQEVDRCQNPQHVVFVAHI